MSAEAGSPSQSGGTAAAVERIEAGRRRADYLYKLFTDTDPLALNECVLGLVSSGRGGTKVGLLRQRYAELAEDAPVSRSTSTLSRVESVIMESQLRADSAAHRTSCHALVLCALVLEPEFVRYVLLHTHDRESLRQYINTLLRPRLADLLVGRVVRTDRPATEDALGLASFVDGMRQAYATRCLPRAHRSTV